MKSVSLKRCPFCGSSRVYVRFYNQPSVVCEDCLCMGPAAERLTKVNRDECGQEAELRWNKRVDYSHRVTLENENARLEAALKGLDGKEWKELMEPTIELMQQLEAYYHQYYSPNWPTPFKDVGKELARLRGLVAEAPKTTPLTSS